MLSRVKIVSKTVLWRNTCTVVVGNSERPRVNEIRKCCIKRVHDGSNYGSVKNHLYSHLNSLCTLQEDLRKRNRQETCRPLSRTSP